MASIFQTDEMSGGYSRRISRHLACSLLVFALLQIGVVCRMGGSLVLHLGIIAAIGGFAYAGHALERRWAVFDQASLPHGGLATRCRIDLLQLWSVSLLGPMLWIPVAIVTAAIFG
jgi:hypothetical protein